ncbi:hypothetical protein BW14_02225 [Bifidobacterium sp. UTBIF-68]|uniref:fluoride efflux transporter FluC n=1 Tax=Bifidobacterium sp. UTBIF-68 TaxID=1465262 RepID=UPI001128935A|nr:CrcB family protein [Bifidobacterium sp. UTBIF-68]TPF94307.1 hypothetical protein BW14_02225 [Bifidobacterium sp. UTBIF-68]
MAESTREDGASEPQPNTMEISAAQVRAQSAPVPQGAAAAANPPQIPLAPMKKIQARFNPLADVMVYCVVFLGGMLGTAMRYGLSLALPPTAQSQGFWQSFHIPTFTANMAACFIFAGLSAYLSQAIWMRKRTRQLASRGFGMGMCGGFSTLSALAIEELLSLQDGHILGAVFYLLASFAGGLIVAACGTKLGLMLTASRTGRIAAEALQRQQSQGGSGRHVTVGETVIVADAGSTGMPAGGFNAGASGEFSAESHMDTVIGGAGASSAVGATGDAGTAASVTAGTGTSGVANTAGTAFPAQSAVDAPAMLGASVSSPLASAVETEPRAASVSTAADATGLAASPYVPSTAATSSVPASSASYAMRPSFEPAPITDEIPLTGDPTTGEAH